MKLYALPDPKKQELHPDKTVCLHDYHIEAPTEWRQAAERMEKLAFLHGERPLRWIYDASFGAEAYAMHIAEEAITVRTGGVAGARYATYMLMQAAIHSQVPTGFVEDYPVMAMRGFLLNMRGPLRYASVQELCHYIRSCGRAKLNTLMVEYDTRFNHGKYQPSNPWMLSEDDMKTLLACAAEEGISVIPLIQTCGHLSFLLSQPSLAQLREERDVYDQLCPLNPDSLSFVKELIDRYAEAHPNATHLHIGGDETHQLGKCPLCAEYAAKHGKGGLYAQ